MKEQNRSIKNLPLDGGVVCFDFINTVHSRKDEVVYDYLKSYDDFLIWCIKVNLLGSSEVNRLRTLSKSSGKETLKTFSKIIDAREILYEFFSNYSNNENVNEPLLVKFNKLLSESFSRLLLTQSKKEFEVDWKDRANLKYPLWMLIKSAYDLVFLYPRERIKECSACGWIFLDKSKNSSRKWCNMDTCGSNDKSLRYYYRKKAKQKVN